MSNLIGTVVAVTGGARGIGAAAATNLAARGAHVAIGDIDEVAATQTAAKLKGAVGLHLDVSSRTSYETFLSEVNERLGPIDVLVANAGVMWVGRFIDEPEESIGRQFAVNVKGVILGFQLATPAMVTRGTGHVIVVASAASKLAPAGEATYAATKHAVYGYCTAVREELCDSGVAVSVLMPTVVETELAAGTVSGHVPMLSSDDVAAAIVKLVHTRRSELTIPSRAAFVAATMAITPPRFRRPLQRFFVPNQVTSADQTQRGDYQLRALRDPGDEVGE